MPEVVGNYVAPKALIKIFTSLSLYSFFKFYCTSSLVFPKGLMLPKYLIGSAHIEAISSGPFL